jgi:hypothetical protein
MIAHNLRKSVCCGFAGGPGKLGRSLLRPYKYCVGARTLMLRELSRLILTANCFRLG